MNLMSLEDIINKEGLSSKLLLINDSRKRKLIEETRPPYSITINIVDDNNYQLLLYDERGYKVLHKKDLSEIEVCDAALIYLRRNTREINRFNESITK